MLGSSQRTNEPVNNVFKTAGAVLDSSIYAKVALAMPLLTLGSTRSSADTDRRPGCLPASPDTCLNPIIDPILFSFIKPGHVACSMETRNQLCKRPAALPVHHRSLQRV